MKIYYLDTSALIKHYVVELGSAWLEDEVFGANDMLLLTSRVTMVEVWSALARRRREASVSPEHHADAMDAFREDCVTRYRFVEFELPVVESAGRLFERHPFRTYDAVQLASALVAGHILTGVALPLPTFVSADEHLLAMASAEGLTTDNPNLHS